MIWLFIILLLAMPIGVLYIYDRRMMPIVMRSIGFSMLRLWLVAALLWALLQLLPASWVNTSSAATSGHGVTTAIVLVILAAWAVFACTRRAMRVFRTSMATGMAQRDYLLANGANAKEAARPFTRRAMRRTVISALRVPLIPTMLMLAMTGINPLRAAMLASLMMGCLLTASLAYILLRTQTFTNKTYKP